MDAVRTLFGLNGGGVDVSADDQETLAGLRGESAEAGDETAAAGGPDEAAPACGPDNCRLDDEDA